MMDEGEAGAGGAAAAAPTFAARQQQDMPPAIGHIVPLYDTADMEYLSPLVCLMRSQIELFSATPADLETRSALGGLSHQIRQVGVGRVGMRCIHCTRAVAAAKNEQEAAGGLEGSSSRRPAINVPTGSVSYPASIRVINQAVRNWQRYHYVSCPNMPQSVRDEFERLTSGKRPNSSRKAQEYYVRRSGEMGLVDVVPQDGVVGIYFEEDARKLGLSVADPDDLAQGEMIKKKPAAAAAKKKHRKKTGGNDDAPAEVNLSPAAPAAAAAAASASADLSVGTPLWAGLAGTAALNDLGLDLDLGDDALADLASLIGGVTSALGDPPAPAEGSGTVDGYSNPQQDSQGSGLALPPVAAIAFAQGRPSLASTIAVGGTNNNASLNQKARIISALEFARGTVQSLLAQHQQAPPTGFVAQLQHISPAGSPTGSDLDAVAASELQRLGQTLYSMLVAEASVAVPTQLASSQNGGGDGEDRDAKRERHGDSGRTPLVEHGYPANLSIFVDSLLHAANLEAENRFLSVADVDADLCRMVAQPDKYLFGDAVTGELLAPSRLYGRSLEQQQLQEAFLSVFSTRQHQRGVAYISGRAGSGKTALVETLVDSLSQCKGSLISVKFGTQEQNPLLAIFRAFDGFCRDLQHSDNLEHFLEVRTSLKNALGPISQVLRTQMPALDSLTGDLGTGAPLNMDQKELFSMVMYALQAFVRAIGCTSHPTVILLDDMHRADKESLDFVWRVITDSGAKPHSFFFVGCYREEEVQADHPLMEQLGLLAVSGVPMWNISLNPLRKVDINELLSDALCLSPRLTASLAKEIFSRTGGNPMFVKQLLLSLYEENRLYFSASSRRWQWNIVQIRSMNIPDNAVDLVLERMRTYGPNIQIMLRVAALIGVRFEPSSLVLFEAGGGDGHGTDIIDAIETAVDDGLVVLDGAEYRFSHDLVWEAAFSLTNPQDIPKMHLIIGYRLLRGARLHSNEAFEHHLSLIVNQLNQGSGAISDHASKTMIAELNLQAGRKAVESYSFLEASIFFLQGSVLLTSDDWVNNYELALELNTNSAETQVALSDYDGAVLSASSVLSNGMSLKDKLRAHRATAIALSGQGKLNQALEQCSAVLKELGTQIPTTIDEEVLKSEFAKTRTLITSTSVSEIINRPTLSSEHWLEAETIRLLFAASRILYVTDTRLCIFVVLKMIHALQKGLTPNASYVFAGFAHAVCHMGDLELSASCATIATSLLTRFSGKDSGSVHLLLNISIQPHLQPLQACTESLRQAYKNGLSVGEADLAYRSLAFIVPLVIFAPEQRGLDDVVAETQRVGKELSDHRHFMQYIPQIYGQALQIFKEHPPSGSNQDPVVLSGTIIENQEDYLADARKTPFADAIERKVNFCQMWLSLLYRKYGNIVELAENTRSRHVSSGLYASFLLIQEALYLGLAANIIVRKGTDENLDKWKTVASNMSDKFVRLSEDRCSWNFSHKRDLLMAETAFTAGDAETAAELYKRAIQGAKEHKFINEEALACECAALFFQEHENQSEAMKYLEWSRDAYARWGAQRKADDVQSLISSIDT